MPARHRRENPTGAPADQPAAAASTGARRERWLTYLKAVGPGMMAGLADNDPAGVATYAIAGAIAGYRDLWLLVLATLMVQAVQVTSAKLGDVTQQGILHLTRHRYGWKLASIIALVALVTNEASLIADTAAIGAALQILTGVAWQWFVFPTVLVLAVVTVSFNFHVLRRGFLAVGLLLLAYVATAFLARPDWSAALHATVVPAFPSGITELETAVALLGTTVSPYLLLWEAEGEREAHRTRRQFGLAQLDVTVGYVASNLVSYFIVVTTAATLFVHHQSIHTAADAALALRPFAGDFAGTIFAVGLLGTGLLAVPMFAISTGFVVTGMLGWPSGLSRSAGEARGFYVVLVLAFLSGGAAALIGVDPIAALFDSQVLNGFLMPVLVALLFFLANDRRVIGLDGNRHYYNVWLAITFVVMTGSAVMLTTGLI